jgi:light-regulated signal transduction histidine kinase (bacteriophytochrome)
LERSNRDLDDFAYLASHDLKEPLRAVANHVRFLCQDHGEDLGDDGRRRIERITELCERSDKLTSDLYSWSRLSRDAFESHEVDLAAVVEEVVCSLADLIEERNAEVQVVSSLPSVTGDRSRLSRVFANLIVNAVKYNARPQKKVSIGFLPDYRDAQGAALGAYFVTDNGIGIAKEYHGAAFSMFKRLNTERAYGPGTGVGLTFVKKIVERHSGRIWLESEPGEGSTFYFTLPGDTG